MNNTENPTTTYTASINPIGFDGLSPQYEVLVVKHVVAGVVGPFSTPEVVCSLDDADGVFARWGFVRDGDWGGVCANGFAEASLVAVP